MSYPTVGEVITRELDTPRFQDEAIWETYTSEGVAIVLCNALGVDVALPVSVLRARIAAGERAEQCRIVHRDLVQFSADSWAATTAAHSLLAWIREEGS